MATGKHILVVEDAEDLATVLRDRFRREGYNVETVRDGESALHATEQFSFDLILLDLMLPGISGFEVCRQLRQRDHATPILMLTARSETVDKIVGLRLGADDYVTKPFDMGELVARLEALLRRPGQLLGRSLQMANLAFDTESRQAFIDNQPQVLSARETAVLELLMRRKDRVVSKKLVEDHIFGLSGEVASNAVEVYVHRLRKQLSERGAKVQIHTIRGVGYLIAEEKAV